MQSGRHGCPSLAPLRLRNQRPRYQRLRAHQAYSLDKQSEPKRRSNRQANATCFIDAAKTYWLARQAPLAPQHAAAKQADESLATMVAPNPDLPQTGSLGLFFLQSAVTSLDSPARHAVLHRYMPSVDGPSNVPRKQALPIRTDHVVRFGPKQHRHRRSRRLWRALTFSTACQ